MRSAFSISVLIWAKTLLFYDLAMGTYLFRQEGFEGSIAFVLIIMGSFIVTSPLLLVIKIVVKLVAGIPYSARARVAFLAFLLMFLVFIFYVVVAWALGNSLFYDEQFQLTGLFSIAAVLLATWTTRDLLKAFNTIYHESDLV